MSGDVTLTDAERKHGQRLDGVLLFHENAVERIVADRLAAERERVWREGAAAGHHSPLTWFALRQVNPYSAARIARGDA